MTAHWNQKFNDLPLIQLPSYMYPAHDGDMAELAELVDKIFWHSPADIAKLAHTYVYHRVCDSTGIYPSQLLKNWDRAAEKLREWRNGR